MGKPITFPCMKPQMIEVTKIEANNYNPNKVARQEMKLLVISISEDGVTQPIVAYQDNEKYIIVDGFHRFLVLRDYFKCDKIPCVVIEKDLSNRMASTIRHNRARGKHQVASMVDVVSKLILEGWSDAEVAHKLGMEAEEVFRLKLASGAASLFKDKDFSRSWKNIEEKC